MGSDEDTSSDGKNKTKFVLYLSLFFILIGVIILCSYNVAIYGDIKNGNLNAPDISNGTATTMVVINSIFIAVAAVALLAVIYFAYTDAVDPKILEKIGDDGISEEKDKDGVVYGYSYLGSGKGYYPNRPRVQLWLWTFSTGVFIISLFNLIQYMKISEGPSSTAVNAGTGYVILTWLVFGVAGVYWLYTSFRTFYPRKLQARLLYKLDPRKPKLPASNTDMEPATDELKRFCATKPDEVMKRLNRDATKTADGKYEFKAIVWNNGTASGYSGVPNLPKTT
jgi:hypothetical protein